MKQGRGGTDLQGQQEEPEMFCLEVFLASIQTCCLSNAKTAPPGAYLSLLDFEPLVFEGLQEIGRKGDNDDGGGRDGRSPAYFCSKRGKSCVFAAEPVPLSRALRLPGALTLMLASKLSKNQAALHGSCTIDVSCFGPSTEVSCSLPRAVTSWGHCTHRSDSDGEIPSVLLCVEAKDLRGRTVATADLTVSLSCLGAVGALIRPRIATIGCVGPPERLGPTTTAFPRACPAEAAERAPSPVERPGSDVRESSDAGGTLEGQPAAGRKRGPCGPSDGRARSDLPSVLNDGNARNTRHAPGYASWACEFNPRNGSLEEIAGEKAWEAEPAGVPPLEDGFLRSGETKEEVTGDGAEGDNVTDGTEEISSGAQRAERGEEEGQENPATVCASGHLESPLSAATEAAAAGVASDIADFQLAANLGTVLAREPKTPISAEMSSEHDQASPRSPDNGEKAEPPSRTGGSLDAMVVEKEGEVGGGMEALNDIMASVEKARVTVAVKREEATGNNRLVTSWRPCSAVTTKQEGETVLNSRRPSAGFSTEPTRARRRTNASPNPGRRRPRVDGGEFRRAPPATGASRQGKTTAQQRHGKPVRKPWGAGPGAVAAPAADLTPSKTRRKPSRDGRVANKGRGRYGKILERGAHANDPSEGRHSSRPPPPPPTTPRAVWEEESSLGPTLLEQFLPTWTSLAAEAAWLCGSQVAVRNKRGGGGGGDGGIFGDGGDGGQASGLLWGRAADYPAEASGRRFPTCERGSTGAGKGASLGRVREGSVGDERDLAGKPGSTGGSLDDFVPAPSLHPNVERVLMDWIKSRVDRDGRLEAPGPGDAEVAAPNDEQEERGHSQRHRREQGDRGRLGDAETKRPPAAEVKPTMGRLYRMFEEALDDLLREERAAAPAVADGRREAENGDGDGLSTRAGVGWVEVAQRISAIAEEWARQDEEQPQRGPEESVLSRRNTYPSAKRGRGERHDHSALADQTDEASGGGRGRSQLRMQDTSGSGSTGGLSDNGIESNPAPPAEGESLLRPRPICVEPYRQLRPLLSPPRLPPLRTGRSRSPPPPLSPSLPLPDTMVASPPPPRPTVAAVAGVAATAAGSGSRSPSAAGSSRAPGSPRASRWLVATEKSGGRGRGGQPDTQPQGGGQTSRGPAFDVGPEGGHDGGTGGALRGATGGAAAKDSPGHDAGGERGGEVTLRGGGRLPAEPQARAALELGWQGEPMHLDGRAEGEAEEQEEEALVPEEETLALEEYESDFEAEEGD